MKHPLCLLLAGMILGPCTIQAADNVIFFIGDGMGPQHVKAGRAYVNGTTATPLRFETLGYTAQEVTILPGGGVTDSATAGTALATGYQHPTVGIISMGANNSIKTTLVELAKAKGMRTGIVTTDDIGGATPGAFGAHEPDRTLMAAIRADYLRFDTVYNHAASLPNILLGGGYDDPAAVSGSTYTYVGLAQSLGYEVVRTSAGLQSAAAPNARLLGLFGSGWAPMTAMAYRAGNSTEPLLSQMLIRSLELLHNPNGIFLMVEGANIDKLSHSNDKNFVGEVAELDAAVTQALLWKQNHPGENTLIFVTADHETGALSVPDQTITPGTIPSMTFNSTGHSGVDVNAFATWPAGIQGVTLDNTETFYILEDFLNYSQGGRPPVVSGLLVSAITAGGATVQWTTVEASASAVELRDGVNVLTFTTPDRTTGHSVVCTGLAPGTSYAVTARSTDLAGFTGTGATSFATTGGDPNAYVLSEPAVGLGTLSGTYLGVRTAGDGVKQTIIEAPDGVGSGIVVDYTLHTPVPVADIDTLTVLGQVSWSLADGQIDGLIAEIRVLGPEGSIGWQPISFPFQAVPPASYVDVNGDIVVRFQDGASINHERKDTLSVDYLAGVVVKGVPDPTIPSVPQNVTAVAGKNDLSVLLTWSDSTLETGYEIWRYSESTSLANLTPAPDNAVSNPAKQANLSLVWVFLGLAPANATSYTDTTVSPLTTYNYVVRAYSRDAFADSAPVSITIPFLLQAPSNLKATAAKSAINLGWADNNSAESGYQVLRGPSPDGNFEVLATLAANASSYSDKNLTRGTTFYYRVRAVAGTQVGPESATVSATAR